MLQIISSITAFFTTIFDIIRGFGAVIANLIVIIGKAVHFFTAVIGHLPLYFTVPLAALVVVSVLYKILGREGQD